MIATAPIDILRFVLACSDEGVASVLVTLTAIEGSAPRAIGAQMAVAADGRYAGSLSGGCIEAAVVAEAIGTLTKGQVKRVRYGIGSPYFDIRLPCGGGIDLLFHPYPDNDAIAEAVSRHDRRAMAVLHLSDGGVQAAAADDQAESTGWQDDIFRLAYRPQLRIVMLGQGEELAAVARLAGGWGADVSILSPDRQTLAALKSDGFATTELMARTHLPPVMTDRWTAIISVFHDRDWEEHLLPQALALPSFYVGAIGSRRIQDIRIEALRAADVPAALRHKLQTSVGLIPATRDPATLALSTLAQIVQEYHRVAEMQGSLGLEANPHAECTAQ